VLFSLLVLFVSLILAGCSQHPGAYLRFERVRPVNPEAYPEKGALPFQFPLDNPVSYIRLIMTNFYRMQVWQNSRH
jgi:hypothetical protein